MAEKFDVRAIINDLKHKEEMNAEKHDGCYELMRETVKAYAKLSDFSVLDYKDLNLVYLTTVGTWSQGIDAKKKTVNDSHLNTDDKEYLTTLWGDTWLRAGNGEYSNYEASAKGGQSIGLFGTGFFSFKRKNSEPASEQVQRFICMLIDLLSMDDDTQMFDRVESVLSTPFSGMQTAAASMILHCLKPYTFPILNSNTGFSNIFEVIGVQLTKTSSLETYIDNCRKIKSFRDQNFTCKNYRIFDVEAHNLKNFMLQDEDDEQYGFDEMVSFLSEHSGQRYIAPDKAGEKADYMTELKTRGQEARQKFINFGQKIADCIPSLEFVSCSNWMNQGQSVEQYLWIELKNKELIDYPQSVSLSIEKHGEAYPGDGYYLSIRSGIRTAKCKSADYKRQIRLLDCDLVAGMTYRTKYTDQSYQFHGTDTETVRSLCENGTIQEVEVIEAIEDLPGKDKCGKIFEATLKATREILPLYEYVMCKEDWWPSLNEYDPGITAEQYHDLFLDENIVKRPWLQALYEMYRMPDHLGTCKQLADTYGHEPGHYISYLSTVAGNIVKATNCPVLPHEENSRYWPALFQGKQPRDKTQGRYCWKMRVPVIAAMERLIAEGIFDAGEKETMVQFDRNTILYGPPGTGKTYNSIIYAVAICDGRSLDDVKSEPYCDVLLRYNELRDAGRVAFTTFHQSYGYEEFIEGIKPKLDEDNGTLGYTIEDGVFKAFCNRAKAVKVQVTTSAQMKAEPRIWGMILGGTGMTELKKQCFENDEIRLGWSEVEDDDIDGDFVGDEKVSWNAKHMVSDFKNSMEVGDVVVIEKNRTSIDAIGIITGEYVYDKSQGQYPRSRAVEWLVKNIDQDMLQFLPNGRKQLSRFSVFAFDYIGMDVISQILNGYLNNPVMEVEQETKPYVFIIDEINRGNISKIFGELITLIEETKRAGAAEAMEAVLPYSGESFSVPSNIYILGTMNTADRSIALMDTALRRRFEFAEMMPDSKILERIGAEKIVLGNEVLNVARMLDIINTRIEYLFDREHTIGHAFFTKLADNPSIDVLASIFEKSVIPLLQEYFYEDYEKIQLVLGDNTKEDEFKFVLDRPVNVMDIFNGNPNIDLPEKGYVIQHSAFGKLESYKQISKDL